MILASMKTVSKPNHSNNLIICKTYLHCDKSKFFVRRPCFFVVPNLSFIWVLGTRAYSRNLGQCSILARRRLQPKLKFQVKSVCYFRLQHMKNKGVQQLHASSQIQRLQMCEKSYATHQVGVSWCAMIILFRRTQLSFFYNEKCKL